MKKSIGIVVLSVFLSMSFIESAKAKDTLMLPPTAKWQLMTESNTLGLIRTRIKLQVLPILI